MVLTRLQKYPACIQVKVTGGGNASPATTPANKLYTYQDGIVDLYQHSNLVNGKYGIKASEYKIPGPAMYKAGSASTPAQPTSAPQPQPTTTSQAPAQPTTTAAPAPTSYGNNNNGNGNNNGGAYTSKPAASTGKCKPKKRAMRKRVEDETRELYDRALVHSQAARAHAKKHASH
ncbi:hypothetical protein BN14_07672 [Rhizoctonia solani AG-1 IB]|uniref:Uncharacterized protein n=1 Tax=Thanatephorus cucumeris (strain AG1-IB / isolate 7/3/14) TaxID=1108050 RepID=M5C0V3_THACB|nr:hypothetical protein BN14_07672 [Rhizoctonia solani AG-1 IB]